jgi:hypothetical protein
VTRVIALSRRGVISAMTTTIDASGTITIFQELVEEAGLNVRVAAYACGMTGTRLRSA